VKTFHQAVNATLARQPSYICNRQADRDL